MLNLLFQSRKLPFLKNLLFHFINFPRVFAKLENQFPVLFWKKTFDLSLVSRMEVSHNSDDTWTDTFDERR